MLFPVSGMPQEMKAKQVNKKEQNEESSSRGTNFIMKDSRGLPDPQKMEIKIIEKEKTQSPQEVEEKEKMPVEEKKETSKDKDVKEDKDPNLDKSGKAKGQEKKDKVKTKEYENKGKGHAYGKNKGDLEGKEFGQQRAEQARNKIESSEQKIKYTEENIQEAEGKIKMARERLEEQYRNNEIGENEYLKRKANLERYEEQLNEIKKGNEQTGTEIKAKKSELRLSDQDPE